MIDPQDNKTDHLPLGDAGAALPPTTAAAAATAPPATPAPRLSLAATWDIQPPDEKMLREQHDLVRIRTPVYAWDKKEAKKKSESAERVDKFRKKQAAEGLRPASVPVIVLDAVKAAGGWQAWQERTAASYEAAATEKAMAATAAAIEKAKIAEMAEAAAKAVAQEAAAKVEAAAAAAPPLEIAEEVKAAGGWSEWLGKKTEAATQVTPKPIEKVVERVEVPAKLGNRDTESLSIGRRVQTLTGWKAAIMKWLLKV